jgi:hypothetical protein
MVKNTSVERIFLRINDFYQELITLFKTLIKFVKGSSELPLLMTNVKGFTILFSKAHT